MNRDLFFQCVLLKSCFFLLALAGCTPGPYPVDTPELAATILPSPTAVQTLNAPSASPTASPPATSTPTPAAAPGCPEPAEGTRLLIREELGYCLMYPEGYIEVDTEPNQVCLVPEGPEMACHSANAFINVEDAAGRTAAQVADEIAADAEAAIPGIAIERSNRIVSGEEAVELEGLPGVASSRTILIAQAGRLYRLTFLPWDESGDEFARLEALYDTVVNSFTFAPAGFPPPAPTAFESSDASPGTSQSAVVVFVKDGNLLIWDEATGQSQTIYAGGDAVRVELSDDGQLAAFVRRSFFEAGGFDNNQQSALWVVELDGENPRELVSAGQLREEVNAAETDSTNFPRLEWVPDSHRLLYSGNTYDAHGYGEGAHTPLRGVFVVDADTLAGTVLAPAESSLRFVAAPDGQQVALISTTGLSFVDVDGSHRRQDVFTYPATGVPGAIIPFGVWTQDSSAFLIAAPVAWDPQGLDLTVWYIAAGGEPAAPLVSVERTSANVVFAPDGSTVSVVQATSPTGPSTWFIIPLPEGLGALSVPGDTFDYSSLSWSPGGSAYVFDYQSRQEWHPLCPNAGQIIEVCGAPIRFGEQIEWFEWIDRDRFLYVTTSPRRLYLGSLDGSAMLIAEDPLDRISFAAMSSACTDDSDFLSDVTIPDGTPFSAGTVFQKTWRVRNSGTCTWDGDYRYSFLSGDRMGGPRSSPLGDLDQNPDSPPLFPTVRPGEEVELSVMLIAPDSAGTYRGQWQLFAPDGRPFGTAPYVAIQVP
jgi:hypothetical protein